MKEMILSGPLDSLTRIFYLGSEIDLDQDANIIKDLQKDGFKYALDVDVAKDENLMEFFDEGFELITSAMKKGLKMLIHCKTSISRSAALVIAYAMKVYDWDLSQALSHVKMVQGSIELNSSLLLQLSKYEDNLEAIKKVNKEEKMSENLEADLDYCSFEMTEKNEFDGSCKWLSDHELTNDVPLIDTQSSIGELPSPVLTSVSMPEEMSCITDSKNELKLEKDLFAGALNRGSEQQTYNSIFDEKLIERLTWESLDNDVDDFTRLRSCESSTIVHVQEPSSSFTTSSTQQSVTNCNVVINDPMCDKIMHTSHANPPADYELILTGMTFEVRMRNQDAETASVEPWMSPLNNTNLLPGISASSPSAGEKNNAATSVADTAKYEAPLQQSEEHAALIKQEPNIRAKNLNGRRECVNCGRTYASPLSYSLHVNQHCGKPPIQCPNCNKILKPVSFKSHMKICIGTPLLYCRWKNKGCSFNATTRGILTNHHKKCKKKHGKSKRK